MSSSSSAAAVPPEDDVCSVCHERFRIPCQANCSHWFCGSTNSTIDVHRRPIQTPTPGIGLTTNANKDVNDMLIHRPQELPHFILNDIDIGRCIIRVWHHGPAVQACKCPICRRLINLLVPANLPEQEDGDPQVQQVLGEIQHYNRIFGGAPRSLTQRLQDLPFFIRRLFRELLDPQRTLPLVFRARMMMMVALSAVYVLSPVDIVPESVWGLVGYFDDLLILLVVFLHLAAVYRSLLLYRHGGQY
ncbi:hypothetical protein ACP4OV_007833 [Aristida adscensionis]